MALSCFMWAVFRMLAIGIVYQAVALWQGKTLARSSKKFKDAAFAIFGK